MFEFFNDVCCKFKSIYYFNFMQPLYKSQQRLLLNLCAHIETRTDLVRILMDLLMIDKRKSSNYLNAAEASHRLYACQSHVMYSRPLYVDGEILF